jgi:hypothetical protein
LAQPIVTTPEPSFKHANMKKYLKRCQWALIPKYPLHITSNAGICWILFGFRCCSWSPYSKRTARMNRLAGWEKPRSWKGARGVRRKGRGRRQGSKVLNLRPVHG